MSSFKEAREMLLLINYDMKVINDKEFFCCCMITPLEFSNLITKIIRDLIYEQKLLTPHQIMALCPFHMLGISVDKEIIGPVKFLLGCEKWSYSSQELQFVSHHTARSILDYFISKLKKKALASFCSVSKMLSHKSAKDGNTALDGKFLCLMKTFAAFQPEDWPCQFYYKPNIYKSFNKFISCQLGVKDSPHGHCPLSTADHSSHPRPSIEQAHCYIPNDTTPKNQISQPSMLSTVLMIGGASPYFHK